MAHGPGEAPPPRTRRKRPPPPRQSAADAHHHRDEGPRVSAPPRVHGSYSPGPIRDVTTTLDQVLALGAGPLNLPAGKIDIPRRSRAAPQLAMPVFAPPATGTHNQTRPYQSLFGRPGATVVPPETQAYLEQQLGNKHGPDEANYLLQSPDIDTLNQRANELGLAPGSGLGNLVESINTAIGEPTHKIAGFPATGRTALPGYVRSLLQDRIRHVEQQTGLSAHLGDHPSDADLVRASFGGAHHDSYWDVLKNLPRDLVETPLYAYQGGVAAGIAANRLAHGDTGAAREIAAQQVDILRHPGAFVQQHPFQALLAGSAIAKGAGAGTARVRGVTEEPRIIPTRHEGVTINRGVSPANDYIRTVQGLQDFLTQPHPAGGIADRLGLNRVSNRLQDQGLKKNVRQEQARSRAQVQQDAAPFARALDQSAAGLTRRQRERVLGNEAMGVTPEELAAFRGSEPTATGPLSDRAQAYLDAARAYHEHSANVMQDLGLLGSGARVHRNVDPLAQVLADQGHPLATRYLEVNQELSDLQRQLDRTPHGDPKARSLEERIAALQQRRQDAASRLLGQTEVQLETLRRAGVRAHSGDITSLERQYQTAVENPPALRTETPDTPLARDLNRQVERERRVVEQGWRKRIDQLERQYEQLRKLRGASRPGDKPRRVGSPAQIQALADKIERENAAAPIDAASGTFTSPRVRALEERLARERTRALEGANRGATTAHESRLSQLERQYEQLAQRNPEESALLQRLGERRSNLVRNQIPLSEVMSPAIEQLQQRLQDTPTRGRLQGQLDQALSDRNSLLNQIAQERSAAGFPEPFRVPLDAPIERQGFFGGRSTKSPAGVKRRGQARYTGYRFATGDYKPPTHDTLVRDLQSPLDAQGYHRLVNHITDPNEGLAHVLRNDTGDPMPIPEDLVAVKPAEPPAQAHPAEEPERYKPGESFASRLKYPPFEIMPGDQAIVVPRAVAEQLVTGGRQVDRGYTLDRKISQALRNALLYSRPAYVLTNLQGNILQNAFANVGPLSYARAVRGADDRLPLPPGVEEGGAARTNFSPYSVTVRDALDAETRARVVAGLLGAPPALYTRALYKAARAVEDATRRAAYYKSVVPAARKIAHADENRVLRFLASLRGVTPEMQHVLEQMAKGEGGEAVQTAAASAMQSMNRVLGDFAALPSNRVVDFVAPFHRWLQFATRLLVVSLPLHYPGKALLLYRLGSLGQDLQNQLGPLTPANQGIVPIGGTPGAQQVLTTAYPNSFATLADILAADQRGGSDVYGLNWRRGVSYLNPFISTAYGDFAGFDPQTGYTYQNPRGENILAPPDSQHPADPNAGSDFLRLALAQALGLIAPLRAFQPPLPADTSIPLPGLTQTQYRPPVPPWARGMEPPQTTLPLSREESIFNLISPFKIKNLNLAELARQGVNQVTTRKMATLRKESR